MHKSVLIREVIDFLHIQNNERFIDATLGAGGHTLEILKAGGRVLGIEADPKMLSIAREKIADLKLIDRASLVSGNFRNIARIAGENGFDQVEGILMDLGISSVHLDDDGRGFSFKNPQSKLDMRLDPDIQGLTAADLLNSLDKSQLAGLFGSKSLALKVIDFRTVMPFQTVGDFLSLFNQKSSKRIHPATKAFMALRIAVNSELDNLEIALPQAFELLKAGGRLAVISFHSGEDMIVKEFFKNKVAQGNANASGLITPSDEEVIGNARSRSAKLRGLIKQ